MKTKYKLKSIMLVIFISSCVGIKAISSIKTIHYENWKQSILTHYDSLTKNDIKYKEYRKVEFTQIKDVFGEIDSLSFQKILDSAVSNNKLKPWINMYCIFWYQEGEVANIIITFVFYSPDNKSWSISYLPYQSYREIKSGQVSESNLNQDEKKLNLYDGEFFTISKYDSDYNCLSNKIFNEPIKNYPGIHDLLFPE